MNKPPIQEKFYAAVRGLNCQIKSFFLQDNEVAAMRTSKHLFSALVYGMMILGFIPSAIAYQDSWTVTVVNERQTDVQLFFVNSTYGAEPVPLVTIEAGGVDGFTSFFFHTFVAVDTESGGVVSIFHAEGHETTYTIKEKVSMRRCNPEVIGTHEEAWIESDPKKTIKVWNLDVPENGYNETIKPGDFFEAKGVGWQSVIIRWVTVRTKKKIKKKREKKKKKCIMMDDDKHHRLVIDLGDIETYTEHIVSACRIEPTEGATNVVVFDDPHDSLPVWALARELGILEAHSRLVHMDTHPDIDLCDE
eukprot:jgi/Bigna1/136408/aug1.33_g11116